MFPVHFVATRLGKEWERFSCEGICAREVLCVRKVALIARSRISYIPLGGCCHTRAHEGSEYPVTLYPVHSASGDDPTGCAKDGGARVLLEL